MGVLIPVKAKRGWLHAIVDDDDYERLSKRGWYLASNGYAISVQSTWNTETKKKSSITTYMHREIMGNPDSEVDHFDRNKLNNSKANLRLVAHGQNLANRNSFAQPESGYRGVFKHSVVEETTRWKGMYRQQYLGSGCGEERKRELAYLYDLAALVDIGLSADLNFPIQRQVSGGGGLSAV